MVLTAIQNSHVPMGHVSNSSHRELHPNLLANNQSQINLEPNPNLIDNQIGLIKKQHLSFCVGCGGQIHDQYILRVSPDLEWHAACLKCQECRQFLDESSTCFVRDGKTYCKRDYVRLFGTKCDKCGSSFSKNDFVMRAKSKIYHIECFRCSACSRQLIPGDEFALRDGGTLYCKEDHDVIEKSVKLSLKSIDKHNAHSSSITCTPSSTILTSVGNNTSSELGSMSESESESGSHKSLRGKQSMPSDGNKPTRVRTVLNEKQLHTLRTCYNANPRPDALMKEQLVEMTNLSPRVIRVWFQNKRCKDKKKTIALKLQLQAEKEGRKIGYGSMPGIPLIASSPVRHDSPLNLHGLEVTSYQPPWKALSDFALHSDLDHNGVINQTPAFQNLVNQMHGMSPNMPGSGIVPMDNAMIHHPADSTDSYSVTNYDLESDEDDMQGSP